MAASIALALAASMLTPTILPVAAFQSAPNLSQRQRTGVGFSSSPSRLFSVRVPQHVAFICDGNSRWAKQNNCSTAQGHAKGADRLVELLEVLRDDGISYCTLYGFSTENWNRPDYEVKEIFRVMEQTARSLLPRVLKETSSIKLRILGDLQDERIPYGLRAILREIQTITDRAARKNEKRKVLTVCLAINYGGRQDILQATQKMMAAVVAGELAADEVTQDKLSSFLSTAGIPHPDLIVRTSGEYRLSNFLLWNAAYSELYMTDVLWPDFDRACWDQALEWYQQRSRRFGSRDGGGLPQSLPDTIHAGTNSTPSLSA